VVVEVAIVVTVKYGETSNVVAAVGAMEVLLVNKKSKQIAHYIRLRIIILKQTSSV